MLKCSTCGTEQESGKFCGKCGNSITEQVESSEQTTSKQNEAAATTSSAVQSNQKTTQNESIEKVKIQSRQYWSYFIKNLKNPSHGFKEKGQQFINAIISMAILSILLGITVYYGVSQSIKAASGGFSSTVEEVLGISLFSVIFYVFIFVAASMLIVEVVLLMMSRFVNQNISFKDIVGIYGAHLSPVISLAAVTFLFYLLSANITASIMLVIVYILAIFIMPLYIICKLINEQPQKIDAFYGYIIYIVAFTIVYYIFIMVVIDTALGRFIDSLEYYL
ncbi:hypothetical protein JFL43_22030 [Viridibacillus sp. YIM B01967]|uniref:Zinc-ribbon domain-containing protein n=1 Tax=Viridibacillus soli TaxID=2798301 RepID=A0ABS1HDM1_9BACL|nr:DUF6574 domain-containing protein [Viridibacillus soli]MBK3497436.1 hypothetical protein [Viridibacillus soli]